LILKTSRASENH